MAEIEFTKQVMSALRKRGVKVRTLSGNLYSEAGWPDRLLWAFGEIYLVEFKGVSTKVEPHQKMVLRDLHHRNKGRVFVAREQVLRPFGIIEHPVTFEPLALFKPENFLENLKIAKDRVLDVSSPDANTDNV